MNASSVADPHARIETLRRHLDEGREGLRARAAAGASGREIVRATSELLDEVVTALFDAVLAERGNPPGIALAAIGGYGRKDLAPYSDIDLLLVHQDVEEQVIRPIAEAFFTALWDSKLEVGAAARTPEECAQIATEDHTARTALLDCRYVAGDRDTYALLERKVLRDLTTKQVDELIDAKIGELGQRRKKFGGSVHLLEPNVKQSPGALRDLQAALWMARARFKAAGLTDLLVRGVLPTREVERLKEARDFLWRVRNQLHYLAGRKEDHLTFHWQEQVAHALGYRDKDPEGLAVEQFMRDYYLAASALRRLADELVDRCAPQRTAGPLQSRPVEPGLKLWQGRLTLEGRDALWRDPSLFVRLFVLAERMGVEIYPYARDLVREEAPRIDETVRADPRVTEALRDAFSKLGRGQWLRQMHREGALGALLPEFGRVTAKHQHDLYHVYTVDVHTVFAMERLGQLRSGDLIEQEPQLSLVAREIPRPLALSLGVLFHDAGKGMGGNHSEKGADLVRAVCERLGVPARDAADAEWLVREHLLMSHVSQRRDLSDPELIADFVRQMGDRSRLDMLFVLTYVDIASVGPGTWTSWKGRLLQELYDKAASIFDGEGLPTVEISATREALLERGFAADRTERFLARMPRRYFAFADPEDAPRSLRLLELGAGRTLSTSVRDGDGFTTVALTAEDKPGLLASVAGVLTAHRIDILRADVFSTSDGRALDVFVVRGPHGGRLERGRWRGARRDLCSVVRGETTSDEVLRRMLRPSGLPPRHMPPVATKVKLDNRSARGFTVVDVFAEDRRGLLHAVTSALHRAQLTIAVARIATEGNRAIDSFYVCDAQGGKLVESKRIAEIEALIRGAVDSVPTGP